MKQLITTLAIITIAMIGCKKKDVEPQKTIPLVTTAALTNTGSGNYTTGGSIVSDGGAAVTQSGIVWSKTNNTPTLTDTVVAGTTANGTFTSSISGINFNTAYYFRAFATNSVGTGYGNVVTLTTSSDSIRFTYNGQSVTYGIIISPTTGKKWLDRNIGAKQVATAINDYLAYGDFFQWGRPADGHQLINWTSSTTGTPVNGTTTVLATTDIPGHSNVIMPDISSTSYDWRSDNNSNRWATTPQGPCPAGWHVPSRAEWQAEAGLADGGTAGGFIDLSQAFNKLKIVSAGSRGLTGPNTVEFNSVGVLAWNWSSTVELRSNSFYRGYRLRTGVDPLGSAGQTNASSFMNVAMAVRCIKD
jgi:uncharacterized protein (TIGR02145 family)